MSQPRRVLRKIGKFMLYAAAIVVTTLTIAHFGWKYSGSNQWELWQDKDGVAIYTLKVPGATRLQFKTVAQIRARLDSIVAVWTDTSQEGCRNFLPGCITGKIYKPFDEQTLNYVQAYRINMPKLSKKDLAMVMKMQVSRDPRTNVMEMVVTDVPELLPTDGCCIFMGKVHNVWRVTPLQNGMVELEFRENWDPGMPYFLYNRLFLRNKASIPPRAERVFNMEKYRNAEFAFLKTPPAETASLVPTVQ